jgi:hypothetical protein
MAAGRCFISLVCPGLRPVTQPFVPQAQSYLPADKARVVMEPTHSALPAR